jgi:hypothetical protein
MTSYKTTGLLMLFACDGARSSPCTPDGPPSDTESLTAETEVFEGEINGTCAPEGQSYQEVYSCEQVEGPCRGNAEKGPVARVTTNPASLNDPDLDWVLGQLDACSCSCCHNNDGESAHIWSWDFQPVWTDSIDTARLQRIAQPNNNLNDDVDPADNHGFSRKISDFPSTDGHRLMDYLQREAALRTD